MILSWLLSPYALVPIALSVVIIPYLKLWHLHDIPSPFPAAWSNLWLLYQCRRGKRFQAVHDMHKRHGPLVRIQPHHVSVADSAAIPAIYGHGNGFLKSEYYDTFVSIRRGLFNTRDRAEHSRKRKAVSHTFSAKSVGQFEQYIHANLELFVQQWTRISNEQTNPKSGFASIDALNWFNYLAFDIIGDLAFGAPFGMLAKGKDFAEVRDSPDSPPKVAPAIEVLNRRGEVSATLGCYPPLKPWAMYLPDSFFSDGLQAVQNLAGIAVARVSERLKPEIMENNTRVDLLARLMEARDGTGSKLGREELTAEALTQLIAGSDTTSNTACALLYWVLKTPGVLQKLQETLDTNLPADCEVPLFHQVKDISYLNYVISETLRIHSTSSLGLPRMVPPHSPPVKIHDHVFHPGDVLSVPAYTIHHSTKIWGPDADEYVPTRWEPSRLTDEQKASFIPFSTGPRACVGRNVAEMELTCMAATVFKNFDFQLEQDGPMETREGFLRKPLGLLVGIKRRQLKT